MSFYYWDVILCLGKIISVAVILQTLELLVIKKSYSDSGIWKWATLKNELSSFSLFLRYPAFLTLLYLRLLAAVLSIFIFHPFFIAVQFFTTLMICLRFRGSFNGGSDFMTLVVLMALFFASAFEKIPQVAIGALFYITLQSCASYFISGIAKIKRKNWRSGIALSQFLISSIYKENTFTKSISHSEKLSRLASWMVLIFECTFPLAILHPQIALFYTGVALIFHLANIYFFGLNRFLLAWGATYPALLFCSHFCAASFNNFFRVSGF